MKDWKMMSKVFIPLSLIGMNCAFADAQYDNGNGCATTSCPVDCCKPCCVPQPKKCINCECYNPQFYDLQCDWGAFVTVDFLYWYARESNVEFAFKTQFIGVPSASQAGRIVSAEEPLKHFYTKTKWDPGVRVGLGWNSDCDGWDLYLNWTWFENKQHGHASIAQEDFEPGLPTVLGPDIFQLHSTWNQGQNIGTTAALEQSISAKWHLRFNQIDLELGRKTWVSRCMTLRPYIGIRGAWTHTNLNTHGVGDFFAINDLGPNPLVTTQELFQGPITASDDSFIRHKIWGVGLLGGIQPTFRLGNWCGCGEFSIYGNFDGALLWGKYSSRARQVSDSTVHTRFENIATGAIIAEQDVVKAIDFTERDSYSRMQGILDLAIGLRWEEHWCCDRYMTSIDLGWEHHYWWDFGNYHAVTANFFTFASDNVVETIIFNDSSTITNLGFGGLVVRVRFDF